MGEKKKEEFVEPIVEVIVFDADVIRTSCTAYTLCENEMPPIPTP